MAHNKAYLVCENKCFVESRPIDFIEDDVGRQNYTFEATDLKKNYLTFVRIMFDEDGDYDSHSIFLEANHEFIYNLQIRKTVTNEIVNVAGVKYAFDTNRKIFDHSGKYESLEINGYIICKS